jgi:heme/copper-type cytochrome/quinol oxidase subunit 4
MIPAAPTETEPAEWGVSADVVATFNVVANRRAKALTQSNYVASGWAYSPAGRPLDIRVVDKDGQYPAAMVSSHGRPDIDRLRAFGFHAEWPSSGQPLASFRLEVVLPQGKQIAPPPLSSMPVGQIVKLQSGDDPDQQVHIALDQMTDPTPEPAVQTPGTDKAYVIAFALLSILSAGYFLLLVFRRAPWSWPAASALAFVLTIVTAQVLLFAILDASACGAMEIRHIFAASILAVLCPVLIFALGRRQPSKNIP